jgi:hypothetical protein
VQDAIVVAAQRAAVRNGERVVEMNKGSVVFETAEADACAHARRQLDRTVK